MEAKAIARYVRVSPRKARIVLDQIRGKNVIAAQETLRFTNRAVAEVVEKTRGPHAEAYPPPRKGLCCSHSQAHQPHHRHRSNPRGGIVWVRK